MPYPAPKPALWALDPAAVDPEWYQFWQDCVICIPAWDKNLGATIQPQALWGTGQNRSFFPFTLDNNPTYATTLHGSAFDNPTGAARIKITSTTDIVSSARVTYLYARVPKTSPTSNGYTFGATFSSDAQRAGAHFPFTDGVVYFDFGGASAGTTRVTWSGYTFTAGAFETWAFTAGKGGLAIYFNGVKKASITTAASRTATSTEWGIFSGNGVTGSDEFFPLLVAVLDAEWQDGQVAAWAADPFGPIRMALIGTPPTPIVARSMRLVSWYNIDPWS